VTVLCSESSRGGSRRRRIGVIVALSALAHITVLVIAGMSAPKLLFRDIAAEPTVNLWLTPDQARVSLRRIQEVSTKASVASASVRATLVNAVKPEPAQSNQPSPAKSVSAVQQTTPAGPPLTVEGDIGARVRAALRSQVGCDYDNTANLTPDEKNRCTQHAAETAKLGPKYIDVIPPEKRGYFDAVQAAYQTSRNPSAPFYRDANGNIRSWGGPPAVGCTFRQHFRPGASVADKIKATGMLAVSVGPLSCGLQLPQGSMTPELAIPTP
jgi:hypothetical protein